MSSNAKKQPESRVYLENRHIVFIREGKVLTRIAVDEIKLIGEYTTSAGPFIDDWFIVFMTSATDWKQMSEYTPGMQEMLQELGPLLGARIVCSLFGFTSWKTSIIWPPSAVEMKMWDVHTKPPETLWQQLRGALGMDSDQTLVLTPAAASVFD